MQGSIHYGEYILPYEVRVQARRTIRRVAIHVEPDGRVLVDAPEAATQQEIYLAVKAKTRWIYEHVSAAKERLRYVLPREYVSGEALYYLGRRYRLKVSLVANAPIVSCLKGAYIEVSVPNASPELVRLGLKAWYRQRAREVFNARSIVISSNLAWAKKQPLIRIRSMRSQWGSCSPSGLLTLNPHLVKASRECVDYVLLHELCHLREHNHSRRFYALLDQHMPGWSKIKLRLDKMADLFLCE
jgi:predicted metal-dependent hydrolase